MEFYVKRKHVREFLQWREQKRAGLIESKPVAPDQIHYGDWWRHLPLYKSLASLYLDGFRWHFSPTGLDVYMVPISPDDDPPETQHRLVEFREGRVWWRLDRQAIAFNYECEQYGERFLGEKLYDEIDKPFQLFRM